MKSTELQIGNWVRCGRRYMKVTQLAGNMDCDDIEPIPLEKIHLAKNGFKPTDETDMRFVYRDGYEICVIFDDTFKERGIPPCIILRINFAEKTIIMPIEYVHELQQAMRIMGCDKEIVL